MGASASFAVQTSDPSALRRPLASAGRQVTRPTMGLIFVAGALGEHRGALEREVSEQWRGIPTLIVQGAGVLTEQGEHEGQGAVAGLLTSGVSATPLWSSLAEDLPERVLGQQMQQAGGSGTALLFLTQTIGATALAERVARQAPRVTLVGGGAATGEAQTVIEASGRVLRGGAVGLLVRGTAPRVAVAPGCRVLGGVRTVTEARGTAVLKLDDLPALDALAQAARSLEGRPMVMMLLLDPDASEEQQRAEPVRRARLRPVRGVDPGRRALVLAEELREGDRVAFAALDGAAARQHLDGALRELGRQTAGAAARFGLYVSCAGRGSALYGNPDVDSKLLRARFPGVPLVGLMSSFEIAPEPSPGSLHFYTGVFTLFLSPS